MVDALLPDGVGAPCPRRCDRDGEILKRPRDVPAGHRLYKLEAVLSGSADDDVAGGGWMLHWERIRVCAPLARHFC
jgi:hypothetical protein